MNGIIALFYLEVRRSGFSIFVFVIIRGIVLRVFVFVCMCMCGNFQVFFGEVDFVSCGDFFQIGVVMSCQQLILTVVGRWGYLACKEDLGWVSIVFVGSYTIGEIGVEDKLVCYFGGLQGKEIGELQRRFVEFQSVVRRSFGLRICFGEGGIGWYYLEFEKQFLMRQLSFVF